MGGRIPHTESLRVPEPGPSAPGQPAPKPRPRGAGDGKRANIPVPGRVRLTARGDAEAEGPSGAGVTGWNGVAWPRRQIRGARGETGSQDGRATGRQGSSRLAAKKSLVRECTFRPYRKPTQVGEARSLRCSSDPWRRNSAN